MEAFTQKRLSIKLVLSREVYLKTYFGTREALRDLRVSSLFATNKEVRYE